MPTLKLNRKVFIIAVVIAAVFIALFGYIFYLAASLSPVTARYIQPSLTANLLTHGISLYGNGRYLIPYSVITYNAVNISYMSINTTLFKDEPPTSVYVLNPSSGCFDCGNYQQAITSFFSDLSAFGVPNAQNAAVVSDPSQIPDNSILVILSGYMPNYMFNAYNGTNITVLDSLLSRGTSILYIGRNFSYMLNGPTVVPNNNTPAYLNTISRAAVSNTLGFNLHNASFSFLNGSTYGPFSYTNVYNGSIVAFPNTLASWSASNIAGYDMARAVSQLFWLPQFSHSSLNLAPHTNISDIAAQLKSPIVSVKNSTSNTIQSMDGGYIRTTITTSPNYTLGNNDLYIYIYYRPDYAPQGRFLIPEQIVPGTPINAQLTVYNPYTTELKPEVVLYNDTYSTTATIPLSYVSNVSNNYTFVVPLDIQVPPGNYIAELKDISNTTYADASFYIAPINITVTSANLTTGIINFTVKSGSSPLSNINYTITINGGYPQTDTMYTGDVTYRLPKGSPLPSGKLTINFAMLSGNFVFIGENPNTSPYSNKQIIELAIVGAVVLVLVFLVKAPARDEFFIDVPELPPHKKTEIRIKPSSIVSTFDKLNSYYHWSHMPLSVTEVRAAISNYIRHSNMPVNLTLNNVDIMLTQMVNNGDLVTADKLYAPKRWISETNHDINYLTTFKKLRVFMVTHAILFTDLDASEEADMVVSVHGEKHLIVIDSPTTRFKNVPVRKNARTYIAFLNSMDMYDFSERLGSTMSKETEEFRMYMSTGYIRLIDSDNPDDIIQ